MLRPKALLMEISKEYPNVWRQVKDFRAGKGRDLPDWADWCYLPLAAGVAIATPGYDTKIYQAVYNRISPAMIVAGATWRITQGVYRFDPELYNTLINQPLDGNIPCEVLKRLPEWCVYIEMYDPEIEGFWAHLEDDVNTGRMELRFVIMFKNGDNTSTPIHLGQWTVEEGLNKMQEEAQEYVHTGLHLPPVPNEIVTKIASMMQLVLYLCADNIDIPKLPQHPINRVRQSGQVDVAREVRTWDVGERIGATIRKYNNERTAEESQQLENSNSKIHASPRPHIRKAHWHSYWIGKMDGERKLILKWLPPIPVNITEDDNNPVVIRRVK